MAKRNLRVFLRDVIRKPPTVFPYIAGFHLLMLLFVLIFWWGTPISFYFVELCWTVAFTTCWLYVCDLRRWAAYGYIGLTIANMILYAVSLNKEEEAQKVFQSTYISALLVPATLFSFFILFFFKTINGGKASTGSHKSIDAS